MARVQPASEVATIEMDEDLDSAADQLNRRPTLPVSAEDVARAAVLAGTAVQPGTAVRPTFVSQPDVDFLPEAPSQARLKGAITRLVELHEISMQMSEGKTEMGIIKIAAHGARSRLGIDRLAVFLKDGDYVRGTWGTDEFGNVVPEKNFRRKVSDLPEHEMVERAFKEQNHLVVRDNVALRMGNRTVGTGWNAMLALWYANQPLGWIACDNLLSGAPLEPFQVEVMKLFASALAQALVRGRVEEELRAQSRDLEQRVAERTVELNSANAALERVNAELRTLSQSDGLTGIGNRRLFDEALVREFGRCARDSQPLSIVLLDVDFFKQYNDACGHIAGDAALVTVARCLEASVLRPGDLVARYGGEEFVVLLPNTDEGGAVRIAERIQYALHGARVPHPGSKVSPHLTVSLGVASTLPADTTSDPIALLELADAALYSAKEAGRNRVCVVGDLD